jgi:hypothetical protein
MRFSTSNICPQSRMHSSNPKIDMQHPNWMAFIVLVIQSHENSFCSCYIPFIAMVWILGFLSQNCLVNFPGHQKNPSNCSMPWACSPQKTEQIIPTDFQISSWVIFNIQLHLSKEMQEKEYNVSYWALHIFSRSL